MFLLASFGGERCVQFIIGQTAPLLFIAYVDKAGLIQQDQMFQRFINIQTEKDEYNDITSKN